MNLIAGKQDQVIRINYATENEHVPRTERSNRDIKEIIRPSYHWSPFLYLLRMLVKYTVNESTKKLIFFPNKNGVSKYYSHYILLH